MKVADLTKKYAKKASSGELESIRIEKAANGFTVSCSHKPKPEKKSKEGSDAPGRWEPPEEYVFTSAAMVAEFVEMVLGVKDSGDDT